MKTEFTEEDKMLIEAAAAEKELILYLDNELAKRYSHPAINDAILRTAIPVFHELYDATDQLKYIAILLSVSAGAGVKDE